MNYKRRWSAFIGTACKIQCPWATSRASSGQQRFFQSRISRIRSSTFVAWIVECAMSTYSNFQQTRPEVNLNCRLRPPGIAQLVRLATGYGLDGKSLIPCRSKKYFSIAQLRDRLWGPTSLLLSYGNQTLFPPEVKWPGCQTDHSYLVPRSVMMELYLHSSTCFHGVVLNSLSTATNLRLPYILALGIKYSKYRIVRHLQCAFIP
jgi:hypothetical protein